MKYQFNLIILLIFICPSVFAETTITVNSQSLNPNLIDYISNELKSQGRDIDEEMKKNIIDRLIELEILTDAATKEGITSETKFLSKVELTFMEMAYTEYLKKYIKEHPISNEDIDLAYKNFIKQFNEQEYKGQHILVKTKNEAQSLIGKIEIGNDFSDLAKSFSIDKASAEKGGDLDWFRLEDMVESFANEIKNLQINELSGAFQTQFGWHVFKLTDKKPLTPPELSEIKKRLEDDLIKRKLKDHIKELKRNAEISN